MSYQSQMVYFLHQALMSEQEPVGFMRRTQRLTINSNDLYMMTDGRIGIALDRMANSHMQCVPVERASEKDALTLGNVFGKRPACCTLPTHLVEPPRWSVSPTWNVCEQANGWDLVEDATGSLFTGTDGNIFAIDSHPERWASINFHGVLFSRFYMWIIDKLPGCLCQQPTEGNRMGFSFDYGYGYLMPMKKSEEGES